MAIQGRAFIQHLRRGRIEFGVEARCGVTVAAAFDELAFVF